jgi:hypothetical protein
MRKVLRLAAVAALMFAVVAPAAPASAAPTLTGERINLLSPPATFDAGTPFHLRHGWCVTETSDLRPVRHHDTRFEVRINGLPVKGTVDLEPQAGEEACLAVKFFVFEFPDGLPAGSYPFDGRWYLAGELQHSVTVTIHFREPAVGQRLNLLLPPTKFKAGAPFHIVHGYCFLDEEQLTDAAHPDTRFDLYLNHTPVDGTLDFRQGEASDPGCLAVKYFLFNFPDGLPIGDHTFDGRWLLAGDPYHSTLVTVHFVG